jgi:hypothetical protein
MANSKNEKCFIINTDNQFVAFYYKTLGKSLHIIYFINTLCNNFNVQYYLLSVPFYNYYKSVISTDDFKQLIPSFR